MNSKPTKPNLERLKKTEEIQALLKAGKTRQEVVELLGVSLSTVDRARIGMNKLPRGGYREGAGRPATGAKPLLRKAIAQDLYDWLETKPAHFLEDVLRLEKAFEGVEQGRDLGEPMVVIAHEDGRTRNLNVRVSSWMREDDKAAALSGRFRISLHGVVHEADQLKNWVDFLAQV